MIRFADDMILFAKSKKDLNNRTYWNEQHIFKLNIKKKVKTKKWYA